MHLNNINIDHRLFDNSCDRLKSMPSETETKTPFYSSLTRQIQSLLVETASPGGKIASERDLSRQFGASTATIARVLRDLQKEGLIERVKGKGTFLRAHSLAGGPPLSFGDLPKTAQEWNGMGGVASRRETLVLANLTPVDDDAPVTQWWDCRVANAVELAIQRQGHTTHILNTHGVADDGILDAYNELVAGGLKGIVVLGGISLALWRRLIETTDPAALDPIPIVHVNWDGPDVLPFDSVGFDGEAGVYLATRLLLDRGHRDIRFLAPGWLDRRNLDYWLRMRIAGFYRALTVAGVRDVMSSDIMRADFDYAGVEFGDEVPVDMMRWRSTGESLWKRLSASGLPDAVVAINDQTARAFVEAARADGASIPGDLSVVGYDDRYDSATFGLTTIHVPLQEIGEAAVSTLLEQIHAPRHGKRIRVSLTPTLVVRKTTPPADFLARAQANSRMRGRTL